MSAPLRLALLLALTVALPALALPGLAPSSAGNGVLMMVHGRFEPRVSAASDGYPFPPPVAEAVATTVDGGAIHLQVIPFDLAARPVVLADPVLHLRTPDGRALRLAPNADPAAQRECREETAVPGFEGPLAACLAFALPAATFTGANLVFLALTFTDAEGQPALEEYDLAAHGTIHNFQQGMPLDLAAADATLTAATPIVVENLVDPVPG